IPSWNCQIQESPQGGSAKLDNFTVGNKYLLFCSGESVGVFGQNLRIEFSNKSDEFALNPLQLLSQSGDSIKLVVTGYKPGRFDQRDSVLTDGTIKVKLNPFSWEVKSILEGKEQVQMVPPFGPYKIGFPHWFYAVWLAVALVLIISLWRSGRRYFARKRLLEELVANRTALTPYNEMNKALRNILRKFDPRKSASYAEFVRDLESLFRLYLVRKLLVPAQEWSDRAILREIKKKHRATYKVAAIELRRLLNEYSKTGSAHPISRADIDQLVDMTRKVADQIEASNEERKK
ncbi:MAG: hypothetical protein KDD35_05520, partial [Bdellovibrionales bacterium]|nr:hypothetical protein [Bdellovibrionales bacterium]